MRKRNLTGRRYFKKAIWVAKIIVSKIINGLSSKWKNGYTSAWIIGTADDRYGSNPKVFYEYLRKQHPDIDIYWITDHPERIPVEQSRLVKRGTIKNYLIAMNAQAGLFTHSDYDVAPGLYKISRGRKTHLVMLDHGQSGLKRLPWGSWNGITYDTMCCYSEYDREIKIKLGVPEEKTYLTGYARSDTYHVVPDENKIKKILIMPTWRSYYVYGGKDFKDTKMYKNYMVLFGNNDLKELCEKNGIELVFTLHPIFSDYYRIDKDDLSKDFGDWVIVSNNDDDIQLQILGSDALISDYSSLALDFMYMNKPVLLFAFDYEEYKEKVGLLIGKEELGDSLCLTADELIAGIKKIIAGTKIPGQAKLVEHLCTYRDNSNCERIYDTIMKNAGLNR